MGKTFKYTYHKNSNNKIKNCSDQKTSERRKIRRELKSNTLAEINDVDFSQSSKYDTSRHGKDKCYLHGLNSTSLWNNLNSNIEWKWEENFPKWSIIGDINTTYQVTLLDSNNMYYKPSNYSYYNNRTSIDTHAKLIGKKQLKRRNEIGKKSLLQRERDKFENKFEDKFENE